MSLTTRADEDHQKAEKVVEKYKQRIQEDSRRRWRLPYDLLPHRYANVGVNLRNGLTVAGFVSLIGITKRELDHLSKHEESLTELIHLANSLANKVANGSGSSFCKGWNDVLEPWSSTSPHLIPTFVQGRTLASSQAGMLMIKIEVLEAKRIREQAAAGEAIYHFYDSGARSERGARCPLPATRPDATSQPKNAIDSAGLFFTSGPDANADVTFFFTSGAAIIPLGLS